MTEKNIKERLASIEAHVEHIRENMAARADVKLLKWAMGGIGTLALSALLLAAKAKGAW